jgi:hypothetical protein
MTHRLTPLRFAALAAALAMLPLAGSAARAFTFETPGSGATNPDGSSKFADPDKQLQNSGRFGAQPGQNGLSVQFGPATSFGGPGRLFQPMGSGSTGSGNKNLPF